MKLFTAGGSVIPNSEITAGTKIVPWTIGYLNKRRILPDKLKLGVGPVDCSSKRSATQPLKKRRIDEVCSSTAKPHGESKGKCTCYLSYAFIFVYVCFFIFRFEG